MKDKKKEKEKSKASQPGTYIISCSCPLLEAYAAVFFGVPFGVLAFFFAGAFLGAAAGLAAVLVTLPDLVLLRTLGTSTTAGACLIISGGGAGISEGGRENIRRR